MKNSNEIKEPIIRIDTVIHSNIKDVWNILTNPNIWWPNTEFKPEKGSDFKEVWIEGGQEKSSKGEIVKVNKPNNLQIKWQDDDWPDFLKFSFTLDPIDLEQTKVMLVEEGWEIFGQNNYQALMTGHEAGWEHHLSILKETVEQS